MTAVADHQTLGEAQAAGFIANPVEINAGDEQIRASVTPWRLPADKVEALISGLHTSFSDEREQVVYEMATCLANSRWVSQGLYDRAVKALGHVGITDVITLMGYYTSVSMTLAFYDVPAGAPGMAR
jgi:hypothetical protein